MKTRSIMIVGVGGQGSLLASRIIGNVLLSQGFDVKVSEVHGMSQRGGTCCNSSSLPMSGSIKPMEFSFAESS
jgi:Pyruvate/2-oxoacid:ferredoxin oxidoreductase gamma subunit